MGKTTKKSASKAGAAPAKVAPSKPANKGKRQNENEIEKQLSAKKQKSEEVAQTQKEEATVQNQEGGSDESAPKAEDEKPIEKAVVEKKESSSGDSEEPEDDVIDDDEAAAEGSGDDANTDEEIANGEEKESGDSSADDEPENGSEENSDDGSEDAEEENEKKPSKTSQKSVKDMEMIDVSSEKKAAKTSSTPKAENDGPKTLFIGNLSYSVQRSDVENFFKDSGEVVDVRLAIDDDGRFKGFGHVEFASSEEAKAALKKHDQELLNRPVRLDLARERGVYTPKTGDNNGSQSGGKGQTQTVFVKGFDKSLGEHELKSSLEEHFGTCGQITRISIPKDYESGESKGFAYLDFKDSDSLSKALELHESDLGGYTLSVDEAKPRDNQGGGGGRGGRFGGGRGGGGRGGRFGGRDGGGRFGGGRGGGGRFGGGRGGGGRFGGGGRGRGGKRSFDD